MEATASATSTGPARLRRHLPRGLALATFGLFAWLVPPGMFWLDSSELSAASFQLGAPHPTGFPLYVLVGKLVALIPLGEIEFRYHLLSALAGAATVLVVVRLVDRVCRGDAVALVAGLGAGLLLIVTLGFLRNATCAEIYLPNALLLALTLLLYERVARGGEPRLGLVLAVVVGLGLGLHTTFRAHLLLPIAGLLFVRLRRGARWPLLAPLLALAIGGALHLGLPVRSATGRTAAVDWEHPRTGHALLGYVTARDLRAGLANEIMSSQPEIVRHDAVRFASQIDDEVGGLALLAAGAGLFWLLRQRQSRLFGLAVGLVALADLGFSIWVHPIGIEDLQDGVPLLVVLAIAAGVGVAWLGRALGRVGPFAAGAVAVMLALGPAAVALPEVAASRQSELPRRVAEAGLAQTAPRGLALVQSDSMAASLLYLGVVEGARPDVAMIVRQRLGDGERVRWALARTGIDPAAAGSIAGLLGCGRPITWEAGNDALPVGRGLRLAAPLLELLPAGAPVQATGSVRAAAAALAELYGGEGSADPVARHLAGHAVNTLGILAFAAGDGKLAAELVDLAIELAPDRAEAWVNRAKLAQRRGDALAAAAAAEQALVLEPNRVSALVTAARAELALGDAARARGRAERAVRLEPRTAEAWALAGAADARLGETGRARERLGRALELDPRQADARAELAKLPEE